MNNAKIECLRVNCGITHELVPGEATLEPVDDGEALLSKAGCAEEKPPELYG